MSILPAAKTIARLHSDERSSALNSVRTEYMSETHGDHSIGLHSFQQHQEVRSPHTLNHSGDTWVTMTARDQISRSLDGWTPSLSRSAASLLQPPLASINLLNSLIAQQQQQHPTMTNVPTIRTAYPLSRSDPLWLSLALAEERKLARQLPVLPPPAPLTTSTSSNLLLLQWLANQNLPQREEGEEESTRVFDQRNLPQYWYGRWRQAKPSIVKSRSFYDCYKICCRCLHDVGITDQRKKSHE